MDFRPKLRFLTKIWIFDQNLDFRPKFAFSTKISIFEQKFRISWSNFCCYWCQNCITLRQLDKSDTCTAFCRAHFGKRKRLLFFKYVFIILTQLNLDLFLAKKKKFFAQIFSTLVICICNYAQFNSPLKSQLNLRQKSFQLRK